MQQPENEALAAAVAAPVRRPRWRLYVDWEGDGQYAHALSDLTEAIGDGGVNVERSQTSDLPAEASLVNGWVGASATVHLSGDLGGLPASAVFSPYRTDSPLYGRRLLGRIAQVQIGMATADGPVYLAQLTGPIRAINGSRKGGVEITIADPSELLRAPITLPTGFIEYRADRDEQRLFEIRTQWVIDYILRRNGYGAQLHPGTFYSMTCHGGLVAEIGQSTTPANTPDPFPAGGDWFTEGPHGLLASGGSWDSAAYVPTVCDEVDLQDTPTGIGVSFWIYIEVEAGTSSHPVTECVVGDGDQDKIRVTVGQDGIIVVWFADLTGVSYVNQQTNFGAEPVTPGWHYVGGHWTLEADGSVELYLRYDDVTAVFDYAEARPGWSDEWRVFSTVELEFGRRVSDVTWWTATDHPTEWPGQTYTGADLHHIDGGVNRLSYLPARAGKDSWELLQEVAGAEWGTVGFTEVGLPYFYDRNTARGELETVERVVTADRELLELSLGTSIDTVRNVASFQTVDGFAMGGDGFGIAFEAVAADQFDTAANSQGNFTVWTKEQVLPFAGLREVLHFTAAQWQEYSGDVDTYDGWTAVRADDPETAVDTGVSVWATPRGPRLMQIFVVNGNSFPVRLADTGGQPALRVLGYPLVLNPPVLSVVRSGTSIDKYRERALSLGDNDWHQRPGPVTDMMVSVIGELAEPRPVLPEIEVTGDPRLQLGDTLELRDPSGLAASILCSAVDLKRRVTAKDGLLDTYGLRPGPLVAIEDTEGAPGDEHEDTGDVDLPDPGGPGEPGERPYFPTADWHWDPIVADPALDDDSDEIGDLLGGSSGENPNRVMNVVRFGVTLRGPDGITGSTPRYDVAMTEEASWGDPFPPGATMPIPYGTEDYLGPGDGDRDAHLSVADPTTNGVYSLWIADYDAGNDEWAAGWGGYAALDGDGTENQPGGSTGAGISRFACVIRVAELEAGVIPHALFFSTNMAREDVVKYPAVKTDGGNDGGLANTIWEGGRVQLDPSLNPDAYGLNQAERAIMVAMQTYGAYCGDNGATRMAFLCELPPDWTGDPDDPGARYASVGVDGDYYNLSAIPWAGNLRVLRNWDGSA